eukprot:gene13070-17519_t
MYIVLVLFLNEWTSLDTLVNACNTGHIIKSGTTTIAIGQDYENIMNYTTLINPKNSFAKEEYSFGFMAYTSLRNLSGLLVPTNYGSGIEWVKGLQFDGVAIQLGLYIVDDCFDIGQGLLDNQINILKNHINSYRNKNVFYIRVGYEFETADNHYPPSDYIKAFQRIVQIFRKDRTIINVHFVWHAAGFEIGVDASYLDWYPGSNYVDYCGISLFQQPYETNCQQIYDVVGHSNSSIYRVKCEETGMEIPHKFAEFCNKTLEKPLIIAESTPFGGIIDDDSLSTSEFTALNSTYKNLINRAGYKGSTWKRWFLPVIYFIQRHDVRMWSYINCNWDAQPMWVKNHAPGIYWGDSRIEVHKSLQQNWMRDVLLPNNFRKFITSSNYSQKEICTSPSNSNTGSKVSNQDAGYQYALILAILAVLALSGPKLSMMYKDWKNKRSGRRGYSRII